jgi:hypothetical protein
VLSLPGLPSTKSMIADSTSNAGPRTCDSRRASRATFLAAMLAFAGISIPLRNEPTPDVSWLITMCERILNGERAYVDIIETTPPVPMLLYMPGAFLAKTIGGAAEFWTFAFAYVSALGSLWLAARILPAYVTEGGRGDWLVLAPAAVVLFLLPRDAFAQREYLAAAWTLPVTAVFIRHATAKTWPPLTDRIFAAVLGGLMVAVKPPLFALPSVAVGLYCWARTRSLSFLLPSGLVAAAAIGFALTAASLAAFADYLRTMSGIMRDVYVPDRVPVIAFLFDRDVLATLACLGITFLLSLRGGAPAATIPAIVAASFLAVDFIQGKDFSYHAYPAAPFAAAAACVVVFRRARHLKRARFPIRAAAAAVYGLAACVIAVLFFLGLADQRPVMRDLAWAKPLDHPRALAVSPIEDTSFPLAREIGARWVGSSHSQWIARYVQYALDGSRALTPEQRKRLLDYERSDLEAILREIREKRPELVIEDTRPPHAWLAPELNALQPGFLDGYEVIADENGIRVLRMKSIAGPDSPGPRPGEAKKAGF